MFDRISATYDLLNRILSFGTDVLWRRKVARFLPLRRNQRVLDLATGTGDQILALFEESHRVGFGVGIDPAQKMLEIGRLKIRKRGLSNRITLMVGDATAIPLDDGQFDAVTIAFGIRNIGDVKKALQEIYRVLKPGGRVIVLEFAMPGNRLLRAGVLAYLRHILPCLGAWVSRDRHAYRYLNKTIETFPSGEAFCDLLRGARFTGVTGHSVPLGLPMIYTGERPVERLRQRLRTGATYGASSGRDQSPLAHPSLS
jgi:demethylmenaquinone methyltransferase/2-methoxy-6-polyprenyl-1,4-benzoquinol methylase